MMFPGLPPLLQSVIGSQQIAPAAPPYQPGSPMGAPQDDILARLRQLSNPSPVMGVNAPIGVSDAEPSAGPNQKPIWGRLGGIFGNLDANLASPSKQLGIGLLGELSPYGALAGLAAAGLLGPNKVFK